MNFTPLARIGLAFIPLAFLSSPQKNDIMTQNHLCIHGHFYQPPRENPWLNKIEEQSSAAPYHDWNERINAECYRTNAFARILNKGGQILKIVNNYEFISFNFGPTLLSWIEQFDTETYQAIIEADRRSLKRLGYGNAIAQVYNHLIMPLANQRDKQTQVIWGIRDFENRFGRKPEGMWLAETAVDTATLETLAANGIQYTILAPRQAKAFRKTGDENWTGCANDNINTRQAYLCKLPSGNTISLFFYDGDLSQAVAFEGLLHDGKNFAQRLINSFENTKTELIHIATDGESYGHHHRNGEMALADCLEHIQKNDLAKLTNYATYLKENPSEFEIQIHENSSWSCYHGVERWRADCGCKTGGQPDWSQAWRKDLRELLDWLRDELAIIFEKEAGKWVKSPWETRNNANLSIKNNPDTPIDKLLEMQRNALFMFTSCAWFFDEISGIETTQVLQYAKRAMEIAEELTGKDLHPTFLQKLENTLSNVKENGATAYKKHVLPAKLKAEGEYFFQKMQDLKLTSKWNEFDALAKSLTALKAANISIDDLEKCQNHYYTLKILFEQEEENRADDKFKKAFDELGLMLKFEDA